MKTYDTRILQLIERLEAGIATPDEIRELSAWYDSLDGRNIDIPGARLEKIKMQLFKRLQAETGVQIPKPATRKATVVLVSLGLLVLVWAGITILNQEMAADRDRHVRKAQDEIVDVMPGGSKAVFITGNQTQVDLDELPEGSTLNINNALISKTEDGQINYEWKARGDSTDNGADLRKTPIATIMTPRGGSYQVGLPDGSRIWLNAGSTITFPEDFTDSNREVTLTGEAYFEVANRIYRGARSPFIVRTDGLTVSVYGTSFNVRAYHDDEHQTTLVSGSVGVSINQSDVVAPTEGSREIMLQPGQQAVWKGEQIAVGNADLESVTAWKEGFFFYNNTDLATLLKQVSLWYDVDVEYEEAASTTVRFNGKIPRSYTLSEFLKVLELSKTDYRIERVQGEKDIVNKLVFSRVFQ